MAAGQWKEEGGSKDATTAGGGLCCSGRMARVRLEFSAGPMLPVEHRGQPKAAERVGSFCSPGLNGSTAVRARPSVAQNSPPLSLSCFPTSWPWSMLQSHTTYRTPPASFHAP
mgnify:CR=1 FL=1